MGGEGRTNEDIKLERRPVQIARVRVETTVLHYEPAVVFPAYNVPQAAQERTAALVCRFVCCEGLSKIQVKTKSQRREFRM